MASQLNFQDSAIPSTYISSRWEGFKNWASARRVEISFACIISLALIGLASVNYQNQAWMSFRFETFRNETVAEIKDLFEKFDEQNQQNERISEWQEKQETEFESMQNELAEIESERISPLEDHMKKTDFHSKAAAARSCQELYDHGFTQSGYYLVDPDGRYSGQSSFEVYCHFYKPSDYYDEIDIYTVIAPKTRQFEMPSTTDQDFSARIEYNASLKQIESLITNSVCYQYITYKCLLMPLHYEDTNRGYWKDRSDTERYFFDGYDFKGRDCKCKNSYPKCENNALCNCDTRSKYDSEDQGIIMSDWILPITEIGYHFHGHTYNHLNLQNGSATIIIGDLRCRGNFILHNSLKN